MKFTSYKNWLNEEKNQKIIILYPGSFKPLHYGHIQLIRRYAEHSDVKEVKVLIGPGVRNGITQKESIEVANLLLQDFDNVSVEAVKYPSPILTAYKYMETAEPGTYAMAGVKKGNDYDRVLKFVKDYAPDGNYNY
jgi:cytidyltransferase-like protein